MRSNLLVLGFSLAVAACGSDDETLAPEVFLTAGNYAPDDPGFDTNGCLLEGTPLVIGMEVDSGARTLMIPAGELLTVSTDEMTIQVDDDGSFDWKVSAVYTSTACNGDQCFDCAVELRGQFNGQIVDETSFDLTNGELSVEPNTDLDPACEVEVQEYVAAGYNLSKGCKSTFATRMRLEAQ